MKTRDEVLEILAAQLPILRRKYRIAAVELFGSYSRGEQNESSDIDLAVEFTGSMSYREHVALEEELASALGARVDIVDRELVGSRIRERIAREAIAV
jgi:predicted nucleotidyltransferase